MAIFEESPRIDLNIVLRLTEIEARFLEGMSGFDHATIAKAIESVCGNSYTGPGDGLYSLLAAAKQFAGPLRRADEARAVFNGVKSVPK